jgi:hypothetical protein
MAGGLVRQKISKVKTLNAGVDGVDKRWACGTMNANAPMKRKLVGTRANADEVERPGRPVTSRHEVGSAAGPDPTVLTYDLARTIEGLLRNDPIIGTSSRAARTAKEQL